MFTENSIQSIHILKQFYKSIHIVKPLTSRPANSEKYLICTGFHKNNVVLREQFLTLFNLINHDGVSKIEHDPYLMKNIICYNTYYTLRQMYYIQRTIDHINIFNFKETSAKWLINIIMHEHKRKSKKWFKNI